MDYQLEDTNLVPSLLLNALVHGPAAAEGGGPIYESAATEHGNVAFVATQPIPHDPFMDLNIGLNYDIASVSPVYGSAAVEHSNVAFVAPQPIPYDPFMDQNIGLSYDNTSVEGYAINDSTFSTYLGIHDGTTGEAYPNGIPPANHYSTSSRFGMLAPDPTNGVDFWASGSSSIATGYTTPAVDHGVIAPAESHVNHNIGLPNLQQSFNANAATAGHVCPSCNKTFTRPYDLQRHAKKHIPGGKPFEYPVQDCKYKEELGFYRKDKLFSHMRSVHPGGN